MSMITDSIIQVSMAVVLVNAAVLTTVLSAVLLTIMYHIFKKK